MIFTKYSLIENSIKVKFLSSLFIKSKKAYLCFLLELNGSSSSIKKNLENFKKSWSISISNKYLKILTKNQSLIRWNWLALWQGVIKIFFTFDYDFDLKSFIHIVNKSKEYVLIGGFVRSIFFSRNAFKWYLTYMNGYTGNNGKIRFAQFVNLIFLIELYKTALYKILMSSFFIFFKSIENKRFLIKI